MKPIETDILKAKDYLDAGQLVAIPTETVYGLAANATNTKAVERIYEAKGRPSTNPLILHFPNLEAMLPYTAEIPADAEALAKVFWPGPLTLLLPKSGLVPDIVTAGLSRVAVRVPNHPKTLALLGQLDFPVAAPSANPSGYISPTTADHVSQQLGTKVAFILDGGQCTRGLESTILGWNDEGYPTIYRKGVITAEAIEKVLHRLPKNHKSKTVEAPGMLSSHYAPHTLTVLATDVERALQDHLGKRVGLISFEKQYQNNLPRIQREIVLSKDGSLEEVAQKLYAAMHTMDGQELDVILIEKVPETGVGKAINDRIQRSTQ